MSRSGLSHRTGAVKSAATGGSGSSRSVPETWSLTRSFGQPSSGTGGNTRTSADFPVTVIPGSPSAPRHSAPPAPPPPPPPLAARGPPYDLPDPGVLPVPHHLGPLPVAYGTLVA